MEAMASRRTKGEHASKGRLGQLWQVPLLVLSLGLFGYAAYLFIDPKPGLSIPQRIDRADVLLQHERPDAAREILTKLLTSEKLVRENEAKVHLLMSRAIYAEQREKKLDLAANHQQILAQAKSAVALGAKPDADDYRRLGESCEALGRLPDALDNYRQAMALDPNKALHLKRKVIELQIGQGASAAAEASLDLYLKDPTISQVERGWALGEKSRLLADRGAFAEARGLLAEALKMDADPASQGEVYYRLGYCAWKLGNTAEAERLLRLAREDLRTQHPLDADAAQLLGKILQDRGDAAGAASFYQDVIVSHPESAVAPLARLGRGVCRIETGQEDAGLADLHDLVTDIAAKPTRDRYKPDCIVGLKRAQIVLLGRENYQGTLELMSLEQTLQPEPPAEFFGRLSSLYEKRAAQVEKSIPDSPNQAEQARRTQQVPELLAKSGDAAIALSRGLTIDNDKGHADALWRGIDLYDRAGSLRQAIDALELFAVENPGDGQTPEALLRLGRAYQAAGLFDKAIGAFQRNQFRYPQSLAASRSGVPLAQSYIAKGPDSYPKAESALLATLGSQLITPEAEEFRDALFELAQLYYRTGRYEEAVGRLEELTERYPKEERLGQLLFLMADSYRKSAGLLKDVKAARAATATASAAPADPAAAASLASQAEAAAAKRERLNRARHLYDRAIEQFRLGPPQRDLDKLYLKLAHFYRADCLYDNGNYEEAIRLYDAAALRYQDDASALAAYIQIVNAYSALGKFDEAKAANERAKWLLRKMPPDAFKDVRLSMPRQYWDDWLKWTGGAGQW
jgi:tetratricopeptide (TPR) repeat protein